MGISGVKKIDEKANSSEKDIYRINSKFSVLCKSM
jgi:hypothetical protein